jgi:hypothetical protein
VVRTVSVGCSNSGIKSTGSRVSEMAPSSVITALIMNIVTGRWMAKRGMLMATLEKTLRERSARRHHTRMLQHARHELLLLRRRTGWPLTAAAAAAVPTSRSIAAVSPAAFATGARRGIAAGWTRRSS